ncbi:MAG TPA: FHA domain-containing protein [Marinagarivorans sp.]
MTIDEINIPQATSSDFQLTSKATGASFPLEDEVLIGRELDCTVRLQDPQIRRYHAKISVSEDGLFLEDLNSKNNTYLNGCRIGTGAWVTLGDELNFDGVKFSIEVASANEQDVAEHIDIEDTFGFGTPIKRADTTTKPPAMPFSNQDVVEATRALEERAKARLQHFKESEESGLNPDWEEFIANRNKMAAAQLGKPDARATEQPKKSSNVHPLKPAHTAPASAHNVTPISTRQAPFETDTSDDAFAELDREIAALEASEAGYQQNLSEPQGISQKSDAETITDLDQPQAQNSSDASSTAHANESNEIDGDELNKAQHSAAEPSFDTSGAHDRTELIFNTTPLTEDDITEQQPEPLAAPVRATSKKASSGSSVNLGSGPRMLAQTAPIRGKCYALAATDAKTSWTIGRASNTDMQLSEDAIDLIHAHIELTDAGYKIRTTRTTNGMLINGKFKAEAVLKHGDSIQFGRIEFIYRDDLAVEAKPQKNASRKLNYGMIVGGIVVLSALVIAILNSPSP